MNLVNFIQTLQKLAKLHKKRVFTVRDLSAYSGESASATAMTLLRASKRKLVANTGNFWINLMDPPDIGEAALTLKMPSYLSCESALYHHGVLSQSPRGALTVITTNRPGLVSTALGDIRYYHVKASLFSGFDSRRMAYPEKAWLDLIYLRGLRGRKNLVSEKIYPERFNKKKLKTFSASFPEWVFEMAKKSARI